MVRPVEFDDLAATSVKVERRLLEEAKAKGVNVSEVLRDALGEKLGKSVKDPDNAEKLRGLPAHVVSRVKRLIVAGRYGRAWKELKDINREYGRDLALSDVEALLPRF